METNTVNISSSPMASHGVNLLFAFLPWVLLVVLAIGLAYTLPMLQKYLMGLDPIVIDGTLITLVAMFTFSQSFMSSDEAYKYVSPYALFWLKYCFGLGGAAFLALKAFRYSPPPSKSLPPTDTTPKTP